eukprot:jgi/Mesen1/6787/ME000348S06048
MAGMLKKFSEPIWNWAAKRYQAAVAHELKKYGLRYDDLLDPLNDVDVEEALKRLPQAELDARNQRLLRAMDTSMKHSHLGKDMQVKAERAERASLGAEQPYQRAIP